MSIEKQNRKRLWQITILSSLAITAIYLSLCPKLEMTTVINVASIFISIFLFVLTINKLERDRVKNKKNYNNQSRAKKIKHCKRKTLN